jgi:hypothetical protein
MSRSVDDFNHERQMLDAAHAQNEAGRDAFVAVAHTALFAASVSFVGEVAPLTSAMWIPVLILGWAASVVGLVALTISFGAARRAIDARRAALNDDDPPNAWVPEALNGIALWSFPVALVCLFAFVTANVIHANGRQTANSAAATAGHNQARSNASSASAVAQPEPSNGCGSRASGTRTATATATACAKEVSATTPR